MSLRPKLALYWAAACGGCEVAVLNTGELLLDLAERWELFFCPCLVDTRRDEVEALPEGALAVTLVNGAIRTTEDLAMARLLRSRSRVLVAFGSCAHEGCVPGLANLLPREALVEAVFRDTPPEARPRARIAVPEGELTLPSLLDRVYPLGKVVQVDYTVPGCPPEPHQVERVLALLTGGGPLPPRGSVLGAGRSTVCEECPRRREDKTLTGLWRTWELVPDPARCLLEQGLVCLGIATREGCGAPCPGVNLPCIGCYGPPEGALDQGASMAGALGAILEVASLRSAPEGEPLEARVDARLDAVPDWTGTLYRFSLAGSLLGASGAPRDPGDDESRS